MRRHSLALLLIDVDLFKSYNDFCGHISGDDCLRRIAKAILDALPRSSDMVSRFGGEEFAVILPEMEPTTALEVAETIRTAVTDLQVPHAGNPMGIQTISIGVAVAVPEREDCVVSLLRASDAALYRAKNLGRNRVEGDPVPVGR